MKYIRTFFDLLLLGAFIFAAAAGVYFYFFHKPAHPDKPPTLQTENANIDLHELLRVCRDTQPATENPAWTPQKLSNRWKYITIHHSGGLTGNAAIFETAHRKRGMENGMAYHFVINNGHGGKDGVVEVGERWTKQLNGGHVHGDVLNDKSIGICLVGDFTCAQPTAKQIASLKALLNLLLRITRVNENCILPHKDMPEQHTACPGVLPVDVIIKNRRPANG